ncbi:sugar phosphate nucleotidyltransferase [Runella sp.]|jgi:NDP-sugar pyrophosphorylase family protein|uniref:sugar phosphate nucleotidyltransferase n=1 Tax=Runella sp. TaxID=1960881 RepID=UPI002617DE2B|nr:sugar phosphate nucleotidyltransferase [Runella sp.]
MLPVYDNRLPLNVVIMAGGQGKRLRPLTNDTPKALLEVGNKPIAERLVGHLNSFGLKNLCFSVGHLGEKIKTYFGDGTVLGVNIRYLNEYQPLGSIGIIGHQSEWTHEQFLVINGDLLTNFDVERFYNQFKQSNADLAVATYNYSLEIPWGILEVSETGNVKRIREKPTISRQINAGIYLFKQKMLNLFPPNEPYEGWQMLKDAIEQNYHVIALPIEGYWVDIGNLSDFERAQQMIFGSVKA